MNDVADDLALIVRNAIAYIKELERQINELKQEPKPTEPVAWMWRHRETGRPRVLMPNERTTTDDAAAWDVVGPLYLNPPQRKPLSGLEVERLLEQVIGSLPVARGLIRAVERAHGIEASGCDYCNHPLYAAIKCKNCGRVTE